MPELPEVETLRLDLTRLILGKRVIGVNVSNLRSIRPLRDPAAFANPLQSTTFLSADRKGKFLSFRMGNPLASTIALVAHMGMSGQLRTFAASNELPIHTHVRIEFADGGILAFIDPRTFGKMYLDRVDFSGLGASLADLGIDPITQKGEVREALESYRRSAVWVKWLMLDQSKICGIGNMYADEILFLSGIRFDRPGNLLLEPDLDILSESISTVLEGAISARGSSLKDLAYRDVSGAIGNYQEKHLAYGREGKKCLRCGSEIRRVFTRGRSSYLCFSCQR